MFKVMLMALVLAGCLLPAWVPAAAAEPEEEAVARIYFDSGKALLRQKDKAELHHFFQTYEAGPKSRVFVVGFADARGDKNRNHDLSLQRAQAVRREITRGLGVKAAIVIAVAQGADNPVADNHSARGRALNRRVEIYLTNSHKRVPARVYGPKDPLLPDILELTHQAERCIRQHRLGDAMQLLNKAHALGGDHYADWHTAWGVAGYYGDARLEETRAHLATALQLDPFNDQAREYLGRTEARQKVLNKEITPAMGRSLDTAILVSTLSQQYEYLRLFSVEPLMHAELDDRPVARWRCRGAKGAQVDYYFDHSRVHRWAFNLPPSDDPVTAPISAARPGPSVSLFDRSKPAAVWESRLFK